MAAASPTIFEVIGRVLEISSGWFAVAVTLTLPRLYRPRLRVNVGKDGLGALTYLPPSAGQEREELWIALEVTNVSDLNAEEVQARLVRARSRLDNGDDRSFSSWWCKISALPQTAIGVPPKYAQSFDLGYLVCQRSAPPAIHLAAVRPPIGDWASEKAGIEANPQCRLDVGRDFDVVVVISGTNTHASYWQVSLRCDAPTGAFPHGRDAVRACVTIGPIKRLRAGGATPMTTWARREPLVGLLLLRVGIDQPTALQGLERRRDGWARVHQVLKRFGHFEGSGCPRDPCRVDPARRCADGSSGTADRPRVDVRHSACTQETRSHRR